MNQSKFTCPNCGSENTQLASIIYQSGHSTGTETNKEITGYNVTYEVKEFSDGSKQQRAVGSSPIYENVTRPVNTLTDLAREVAPPTPPVQPEMSEFVKNGGSNIIDLISKAGSITYILSLAIFITLVNSIAENFKESYSGFLIIAIIAFIPSFIYAKYKDQTTYKKAKEKYDADMKEYEKQMEDYKGRYEVWKHICFCHRCGEVFHVNF